MPSSRSRSRQQVAVGEPPPLILQKFLPYRLSVLAEVVSAGLAQTYGATFGIGVAEWRVLSTVGEYGSITARDVGAHARMSKVKVSRAVSALMARRLLRRSPSADDRREAFLQLTDAGRGMYADIVPIVLHYLSQLTADLSASEEATLSRLINKLLCKAEHLVTSPPA